MQENQNELQSQKSDYELRREQKLAEQKQLARKRLLKRIGKVALMIVLVGGSIGSLVWFFATQSKPGEVADITKQCVQHGRLGMHIHPVLRIVINSKDEVIPANTGIPSPSCMRPVHTHDTTGTLHIESKEIRDFRLKEFFAVWGKPFNREQILDYKIDEKHRIRMTVNGIENNEFEKYHMKDKDKNEIRYE